jgi:hypothetical protein
MTKIIVNFDVAMRDFKHLDTIKRMLDRAFRLDLHYFENYGFRILLGGIGDNHTGWEPLEPPHWGFYELAQKIDNRINELNDEFRLNSLKKVYK